MDNEDLVEGVVVGDEFHDTLQAMNAACDSGRVVSITWSTEPLQAGYRAGVAVRQLQYGMSARAFTVYTKPGEFTLRFAGRQKRVVSDYFDD